MDVENEVDLLRSQVAALQRTVEHLLARGAEAGPPPVKIVNVKQSGSATRLQTFDGTDWIDAPAPGGGGVSDVEIAVEAPTTDLAIWRPAANRYESFAQVFRRIEFTLPNAITSGDAFVASCPVVAVWYGADPGSTVTVYNDYGWEGDAGAQGIADYRPTDGKWVIVLLPCAAGSS